MGDQRARDAKERSRYASRGNRTKEEYNAHMERSETRFWARMRYIENYRDVEIYRNPKGAYIAKDQGMTATDLEALRYLIDSKIDTGSAVDELLEGEEAIYAETRKRIHFRSLESSQSQGPAIERARPSLLTRPRDHPRDSQRTRTATKRDRAHESGTLERQTSEQDRPSTLSRQQKTRRRSTRKV